MSARITAAAALFALLAAAPQLAAQEVSSGALTDADKAAIKELVSQWVAHAKMGHADVVAKLYAEDAMELPPNTPAVKGRAAIEGRIGESIADMTDLTITSVEIMGMGSLAVDRGTYSVTVQEEGMEEPMTISGKYISVLSKQADGSWKISRLIWNEDTPAPGMPEM